jgi:hypothetical protein
VVRNASYATLRREKNELNLQSKRIGFGPLISYWANAFE